MTLSILIKTTILISTVWFTVADLVGAWRHHFRPLAFRSIGFGLVAISYVLELSNAHEILFDSIQLVGLLWLFWYSIGADFHQGLTERGLTFWKLVRFQ